MLRTAAVETVGHVALGGTTLYRSGREFFIGLILGEAFVAAFWLVIALMLNAMGLPYYTMYFLPS